MKIAVLLGGNSAEREVSFASGEAIARALLENNHEIFLVDPAMGAGHLNLNEPTLQKDVSARPPSLEELPKNSSARIIEAVEYVAEQGVDLVFVGLHGGAGEDGRVQSLLDLAGLPYTGSGYLACALAMNKIVSKRLFEHQGIPTASWVFTRADEMKGAAIKESLPGELPYPVVVKPGDQGSTVGLTIVWKEGDLEKAMELAGKYSNDILIEKYIPGREMTVAILGDRPLPVIEIKPKHGIYDYECKYQSGMTTYEVPANISETLRDQLQDMALRAHRSLGCRQYSRVDFRVDEQDNPFCLEVNTLPGMTKTSLVPKAAKAFGLSFPQLIQRIVDLAVL
ncbi:MAG: D-alanine--D-alanine ligase [Calditrichaeota bacterium]|nr:D-alanine--D-alanine ligase [Calditrichota bacterium]